MSRLRLPSTPSPGNPFDQASWRGPAARGEEPLSIVQLIRAGTLDVELAALLWLLVEARTPLLVAAGPRLAGKTTILTALLEFLPPGARLVQLRGWSEDFAWLPEAARLGWHGRTAPADAGDQAAPAISATPAISPYTAYLVANELSPHLPFYTWGEQARIALRATSVGYGLGATLHADSLEEVFGELGGPDVGLTSDELSHIGLVLVLRMLRGPTGEIVRRVAAAHFVRPVARDAGGHVQRLPPAVLATWEPRTDAFEHFAWGVTSELAGRTGHTPADFGAEHARRADLLAALVAAGVDAIDDVRKAIDSYRLVPGGHRH